MNSPLRLLRLGMFLLFVASSLSAEDTSEKGFALMKTESFGNLKLDMPAAKVVELLGKPEKTGKQENWEAIGLYVEEWSWPKKGISMHLSSEEKSSAKTVLSLTLSASGKFKTQQGIKIGSTEAEVQAAYADSKDKEASKPGQSFVAGSVYGGMIFSFKSGKVTEIFLGAAAE
jgi:hypothetical protein